MNLDSAVEVILRSLRTTPTAVFGMNVPERKFAESVTHKKAPDISGAFFDR
jgi:hypothetical protein